MTAARRAERYREQLASAVLAVVFTRGDGFLWRGTPPRSIPHRLRAALTPERRRALSLFLLRERLYEDFYCRGGLRGQDFGSGGLWAPDAGSLATDLSRANSGAGSWERGWTCQRHEGEVVEIARAGLTVKATFDDLALDPPGDATPGSSAALRVEKESRNVSPGYYFALGNEEWPEAAPIVRVYWNLLAAGAVPLIREVTTRWNAARVPFRIKTLEDPAAYTRCDAAVLYFPRETYGAALPLLAGIHRDLSSFLKAPIPVFTKELAPGLGLAEDPVTEDSFGMSRCQWLAEALLKARDAGEKEPSARIEIVARHLTEQGVDLEKPYLNPGSVDGYDFPPAGRSPASPRHGDGADHGLRPSELVLAAGRIGQELTDSAIRFHERACWVGPDSSPDRGTVDVQSRYSALGPDLYAGTSGIALFLAELGVASGAEEMRSLARDAANHALACLEASPPSIPPGLFDGWSGAVLASARVGLLLDEPDLLTRAQGLVRRRTSEEGSCEPFDLISGTSGLILALLILADLFHEERLRKEAIGLGDSLLGAAQRDAGALSWTRPDAAGRRNLTGLSHGTAGAAYSLLELFRSTGETRFREGAVAAFAYERDCFSPAKGNWPDFRQRARTGQRGGGEFAFPSHWCHGAPGIALSRLLAWEILGAEEYEEQARIALATTAREAERRLSWGIGNLSLCHGLAGDAEVLLCGCRHPLPSTVSRELPERLAAEIIHRLGLLGEPSPSGEMGGPLGLMSGLAGVGYLFLRLADENIPSVLMPRGEGLGAPPYLARRSKSSASQTSGC